MKEISSHSLTWAYSIALAIVATLSILSHMTLNGILREQEGSAAIIDVVALEPMLSQRIASLAAQYALGDARARDDLVATTERFEIIHTALSRGDAMMRVPAPSSPALIAIYGNGDGLDATARDFIAHARAIAAMTPDDEDFRTELAPLLAMARSPLLEGLEKVARFHEDASEIQHARLRVLMSGSLIVVMLALLAEAMGIFRPMVERIHRYTTELLRIANRDALTGVLNRKGFGDQVARELLRADRYRRPTSLLMIDADHFKAINDRHGHPGGDVALHAIATTISSCLRPADILGRIGGEEFGVLLPETGLSGALAAAERIRHRVEETVVACKSGEIRCSVSIGATEVERGAQTLTASTSRADAALYEAKAAGRNRVVAKEIPVVTEDVWVGERPLEASAT